MILAEPTGAADVGDSPGLSREAGDDDNREIIVCAAPNAAADAGVGPSDEFLLSVEGKSKERTVWASSWVTGVRASAELSRGEDECDSRENMACAALSGVREDCLRDSDWGSLGCGVLMVGKSR